MKPSVLVTTALLAVSWAGCNMMSPQAETAKPAAAAPTASASERSTPPAAGNSGYLGKMAVKSEGPNGESASAVDSAIAWSEKYSKVSEELVKTQQEKHDLEDKNQKLIAQITKLQNDQEASQRELTEANQLLLDMRQDLEKWKANVIGFREEMRASNKAQLEAMKKVIVLLGGEVPSASLAATQPAPAAPARAVVSKKGDSGESGE
jgi:septal ring factor EnvC (AmiA/AmiB activator)